MREDAGAFDSLLQSGGYKLTTQRQAVLEVTIKNRDKHLSVEEIFAELKRADFRIGLATVYRSMKLFEKIGLVRNMAASDGGLRYQIIDPQEEQEHHHLICEICGDVIDIQNTIDGSNYLLELFAREAFFDKGFSITRQKIQFYGKCKKCSKEFNREKCLIS